MAAALGRIVFRESARFSSLQRLSCLLSQDLSRCSSLRLFNGRLIFTSSFLEKEETELEVERNPFYDKYAEKIKTVKDSLEEKESASQKFENKMEFDPRTSREAERLTTKGRDNQKEKAMKHMNNQFQSRDTSQYGRQTLDSVIRMDYIEELSGKEIAQIWKSFHQKKECISACIPSNAYQRIQEKAAKYPLFIYPLPRENGYEFMFAQFSGNFCYVTPLLQYQTLSENAPWVLAIKHFTELSDSKGIVLMVGEVDTKQLSVIDAQWLGYQIQMYYSSVSAAKDDLLRTFNREPDRFDHTSAIELLQSEIASGAVNTDIIKDQF